MSIDKTKRQSRWYFGGLASAGAACCTHPLDLLKVHLQTQQEGKLTIWRVAVKVVRDDGFLGLYNGLSASLVRQMPAGIVLDQGPIPFYQKVFLAGTSGALGGLVGTPGDMVNVRMQNDMKLPVDKRRNYKHAIDGIYRVTKEEGLKKLFSGATMATTRAIFMTIGQLSMYDQFKQMLLTTKYFKDNLTTHFTASLLAAGVATTITQPLDVLKTRMMNAKPGEFKGIADCFLYTAKMGPLGFFKGYVPAFVRLAPQTIFTFVFFEQLRLNFGYFDTLSKK